MKKTIPEVSVELSERLSKKYGDPAAAAILAGALTDIIANLIETLSKLGKKS